MGMSVTLSTPGALTDTDAEQLLKLQYLCYQSEAETYADWSIDPLTETLGALRARLANRRTVVARLGEEVVGAVCGWTDADGVAHIERLVVHPRLRRHGLGGRLLRAIEEQLATPTPGNPSPRAFRLFTGERSLGNIRLYRKLGYAQTGVETAEATPKITFVVLEKPAAAPATAVVA
ncbi:GNAT family N-acetyltransferase [Phaeacidiphilus oryzae]|uniref:GNAT family N-acetyltransferase n=1 Tax=Phaeacidiphilus oryzae TaxID=348818 RepID=UPI00056C24EC|nr:GNAT family N-acetyltransferase [Phaeacidiphilus oryzae]